jgi:23S rRNA pseudouridine955/2504/2580 synthase/23S rRNA pseudouridine1911/1915/1917 synthase
MKKAIEIIFKDASILAVNKPAGLLTIPDRFHPEKENLVDSVTSIFGQQVRVVHRLDKDTSGVICFALHEDAQRNLTEQFSGRMVKKTYLAIVEGVPAIDEFRVEQAIVENSVKLGTMKISSKGKKSITDFKVIERFKNYAILEGYPLMVDPVYGAREAFFLSQLKGRKFNLGKNEDEHPLISRLTLHAMNLSLQHPVSGEPMEFNAQIPKDLNAVISQLKKWNSV